jgi:hypothetical protein
MHVLALSGQRTADRALIPPRLRRGRGMPHRMYYLVTGRILEWSNRFGHAEALEGVGNTVAALSDQINGE